MSLGNILNNSQNVYRLIFLIVAIFILFFKIYDFFYPESPLYKSIIKDIPWVFFIIYSLIFYKNDNLKHLESLFFKRSSIVLILLLLPMFISLLHLKHKFLIDILQRDLKNIQYFFMPIVIYNIFRSSNLNFMFSFYYYFYYYIAICINVLGLFLFYIYSSNKGVFDNHLVYGFFNLIVIQLAVFDYLSLGSFFFIFVFFLCYLGLIVSNSLSSLFCLFIILIISIFVFKKKIINFLFLFIVFNMLLYNLGFFNAIKDKYYNNLKSIKENRIILSDEVLSKENETSHPNLIEIFKKPYYYKNNIYFNKVEYTSFYSRIFSFYDIKKFLNSSDFFALLFGDFKTRNFIEYDNFYFVVIRNNGVLSFCSFFVCWLFLVGCIRKNIPNLIYEKSYLKYRYFSIIIINIIITPFMSIFSFFYIIFPSNFIIIFNIFYFIWIFVKYDKI